MHLEAPSRAPWVLQALRLPGGWGKGTSSQKRTTEIKGRGSAPLPCPYHPMPSSLRHLPGSHVFRTG